jgi:hypothetical protein
MKQTPENIIKKQIKDYLNVRGWFNFPVLQGLGSHPGIPDRIAIKDGRVLFIEIKSPRGNLSEPQKKFGETIRIHGGHYIVARGFEDIHKAIEGG